MEQEQHAALWGAINSLRTDLTEATNEVKTDVKAIKESTAEIVAMFQAGKGAFKVLGWLGSIAKWVGAIAGGFVGVYGVYTAYRHGVTPAQISPK